MLVVYTDLATSSADSCRAVQQGEAQVVVLEGILASRQVTGVDLTGDISSQHASYMKSKSQCHDVTERAMSGLPAYVSAERPLSRRLNHPWQLGGASLVLNMPSACYTTIR